MDRWISAGGDNSGEAVEEDADRGGELAAGWPKQASVAQAD